MSTAGYNAMENIRGLPHEVQKMYEPTIVEYVSTMVAKKDSPVSTWDRALIVLAQSTHLLPPKGARGLVCAVVLFALFRRGVSPVAHAHGRASF